MATTDQPPAWVADYIGLPWRTLGRSRSGLDCYGLLWLVMRERFGVSLPALDGGWTGSRGVDDLTALARFVGASMEGWRRVDFTDRRPGDGVLLIVHGRPIHVGVVVARDWFLHIQQGHDAAIERFDSAAWCSRLEGIYRHAKRDWR
jgi:cell wall-associated NlpC family hydrolase